ncbi:MAG: hypothetical protein ACOC0B_00350 [bacterium]
MKTGVFVLLLGIAAVFSLPAQTAEIIETIGNESEISVGSAAYIAAASSNLIEPDASPRQALDALADRGYRAGGDAEDESVRLDRFAYMLMVAHDLPGGVMYSLFPGPRYAFREFEFERILRGGGNPGDPLSGTRALRLTGRVLSIVEARG